MPCSHDVFVSDWQIALSLRSKKHLVVRDSRVERGRCCIDRQASSEMKEGRSKRKYIRKTRKKKSKNNDIPLLKDCFRYGYIGEDAVVFFQQFVNNSEKTSKPYTRWLKTCNGHLFQFSGTIDH